MAKIKSFSIILYMLVLVGCSTKTDSAQAMEKEPLLNFVAVADLQDTLSEFSQVLLKIELLNTKEDILKHGINTPDEHQARLNYYRTKFKNDIYLISHKDTIACYDVHAERLFMDLPYMNFILTFNHHVADKDLLQINDIVYSNKSVLVDIDQIKQAQ